MVLIGTIYYRFRFGTLEVGATGYILIRLPMGGMVYPLAYGWYRHSGLNLGGDRGI